MSLAMKMLADMAGISPDDVQKVITDMQQLAAKGVTELETTNKRLSRIEAHLGIVPEGLENGETQGN